MTTTTGRLLADEARACVAAVLDPELPMVTIEDLGVLRDVRVEDDVVQVTITPTYAGCPAMDAIRADIEQAVHDALPGRCVVVHTVLAPAWSTDDLTDEGRRKLAEGGIAPPRAASTTGVPLTLTVRCPQCGSPGTRELSRFGSTACKALWVCNDCAEPFDRFKEH
ncbi:1,2-phenylacetyl-CoA epoxidase subunit PaaD [Marmoricola sp. URHA0025 HA25]